MSLNLREVFPILADSAASGAGYDVTRAYEGFAASGVTGAVPALVAKDSNGNLIFLQLDAQGRLPVASIAGVPKAARGDLDDGVTSGYTEVTGGTIILTGGKTYANIQCIVSCFRETHAELVWNDNGTEKVLADIVIGPGEYTYDFDLLNEQILAGTGTQELMIKALNINKASGIRSTITCLELL